MDRLVNINDHEELRVHFISKSSSSVNDRLSEESDEAHLIKESDSSASHLSVETVEEQLRIPNFNLS